MTVVSTSYRLVCSSAQHILVLQNKVLALQHEVLFLCPALMQLLSVRTSRVLCFSFLPLDGEHKSHLCEAQAAKIVQRSPATGWSCLPEDAQPLFSLNVEPASQQLPSMEKCPWPWNKNLSHAWQDTSGCSKALEPLASSVHLISYCCCSWLHRGWGQWALQCFSRRYSKVFPLLFSWKSPMALGSFWSWWFSSPEELLPGGWGKNLLHQENFKCDPARSCPCSSLTTLQPSSLCLLQVIPPAPQRLPLGCHCPSSEAVQAVSGAQEDVLLLSHPRALWLLRALWHGGSTTPPPSTLQRKPLGCWPQAAPVPGMLKGLPLPLVAISHRLG